MIQNNTTISFKGYDVAPLRGLYMQGIRRRGEINIFREMRSIAKKEGLDIFVNQDNKEFSDKITNLAYSDRKLSIWGQDTKAFVLNKNKKILLWNTRESSMKSNNLGELSDFTINEKQYVPRGGNYYLGYNQNGEKWILINTMTIYDKDSFNKFGDMPTVEHIQELFDVKPENIFMLSDFTNDLDEIVRPIGYPNILVNDYNLSMKNLARMKAKFPNCYESYSQLNKYIDKRLSEEVTIDSVKDCDKICAILKGYGFNPIRIGGRYSDDINYMNALAFQNNSDNISYITNSTKKSYPELEFLEKLFEADLREKVPNISNVYFVSGGKMTETEKNSEAFGGLYSKGLNQRNVIMDILANRLGGIHCMTAEIPDFDKIVK